MPAEYIAKSVKCPFYKEKQGEKNRIKCEGVICGTSIQLTFCTDDKRRKYLADYCCRNFLKCRIYTMLFSKYTKDK